MKIMPLFLTGCHLGPKFVKRGSLKYLLLTFDAFMLTWIKILLLINRYVTIHPFDGLDETVLAGLTQGQSWAASAVRVLIRWGLAPPNESNE